MAYFLVDEPKVVIWIENGELVGLGTNVSPDLTAIRTNNKKDFLKYTEGMPFVNSILDKPETG